MRMSNNAVLGMIGVISGIAGVVINLSIANWSAAAWAVGNLGWALAYYVHYKMKH